MTLNPVIEAAALRETEHSLLDLVQCAINCGLEKSVIAFMMRTIADQIDPPSFIHPEPDLPQ